MNVVVNGTNVIAVDILLVEPYWNIGLEYSTILVAVPLMARLVACATGMLNVHTPN